MTALAPRDIAPFPTSLVPPPPPEPEPPDANEVFVQTLHDSGEFQTVLDKLAPAIKQVVENWREIDPDRVPDVRGLCGTERDKFYSDLYAELVGKAYSTLHQVVEEFEDARKRPL